MDGHEFSKMDKNKSASQTEGTSYNLLTFNLDADEDRRFYMEEQFKYWQVENHVRISGYDGREDDVSSHLKGRIPDNVSQLNWGAVCLISKQSSTSMRRLMMSIA